MSWDEIISYSESDLKPRLICVDQSKRIIQTKKGQAIPQYLTPFFNKDKFDYRIMFTQVPQNAEDFPSKDKFSTTENRLMVEWTNQSKRQEYQDKEQVYEQGQRHGQELGQDQGQGQYKKQEEEQDQQSGWKKGQPILKQILEQQRQQQEQKQQSGQNQRMINHLNQSEAQESEIMQKQNTQRSQIENFSRQFHKAQQIALMKKQKNENSEQFNRSKDNGIVHEIMAENILQISQIKEYKEIINQDEQQYASPQLSQSQKQKIASDLNNLQFKLLKYQIKTQNCQKINIKTIINPYGKQVKVKQLHQNDCIIVQKKKTTMSAYVEDLKIWQIGKSKTQSIPSMLQITCYSCRKANKCQLQPEEKSCSTICLNQTCTKNITFQITKIILQ